ncbi:hypothetical protein [Thermosyntropha lipolytica]|nr:hypothetical protein [Thermosyntropha lipolytica]
MIGISVPDAYLFLVASGFFMERGDEKLVPLRLPGSLAQRKKEED